MAPQKKQSRRVTIRDARKQLIEEEASKLINEEELKADALTQVEQNGIVFIDEIDKIARQDQRGGGDVSREGVQRDLLPLIEGCTVNTKHGMVRTDHILFIGSGAFHFSKPSDLIPELQGRLPLRVELKALTQEDFAHILTGPDCSLTEQYKALLATEGLQIEFMPDGVARLAEIAFQVNERTENIGARRLHTLLEKLLEEVSFSASERAQGETLHIDAAFVSQRLDALVEDVDLSRFIL
jgi:ATP-dependent HslUV protease ATP-binding subunit HslU